MTLSRGQAGVAMDYFAMDGGSPGGAHGTRRGGAARRGRRRTYSGGDSSGADTPLLTPGASFARIAAEDRAARARHRERRRAMTVAGLARASAAGTGTTAAGGAPSRVRLEEDRRQRKRARERRRRQRQHQRDGEGGGGAGGGGGDDGGASATDAAADAARRGYRERANTLEGDKLQPDYPAAPGRVPSAAPPTPPRGYSGSVGGPRTIAHASTSDSGDLLLAAGGGGGGGGDGAGEEGEDSIPLSDAADGMVSGSGMVAHIGVAATSARDDTVSPTANDDSFFAIHQDHWNTADSGPLSPLLLHLADLKLGGLDATPGLSPADGDTPSARGGGGEAAAAKTYRFGKGKVSLTLSIYNLANTTGKGAYPGGRRGVSRGVAWTPPSPHGSVTSFPRIPILFLAGCAISM